MIHYKNSYQLSQSLVQFNTFQMTGACRKLKLTGGMKYPEGQIHATFVRQGQDMELKTKYKSTKGDDLQVFYSPELSAWTVGR